MELLEQAITNITPCHNLIASSSPPGFSSVKPEHISQVKAMTWSQAETKLYRIKVAVDEIEQLKFECDAAILAASAHVEEQTAAEHNPGIANATARLREINECSTRRRIRTVTWMEPTLTGFSHTRTGRRRFRPSPKRRGRGPSKSMPIYVP